jgi:hypothetical protein
MIRKVIAIIVIGIAFWVFFIDELYKLETLEWVPNILGPILIVVSLYIWNPEWLKKRQRGNRASKENDSSRESEAP